MRLRTDDDIYRARLVYLGPPGYTLPFQLSYAQYGLFVLLVPVFVFIHYLFTFTVDIIPAWAIAPAVPPPPFVGRCAAPERPPGLATRPALPAGRGPRAASGQEQRTPRLPARHILVREKLL